MVIDRVIYATYTSEGLIAVATKVDAATLKESNDDKYVDKKGSESALQTTTNNGNSQF